MDDTNGHTCEDAVYSVPLERERLHGCKGEENSQHRGGACQEQA